MPGTPSLVPVVGDVSSATERFDALVLVAAAPLDAADLPFSAVLAQAQSVDKHFGSEVALLGVAAAPGGRLVVAPAGRLDNDTDDVRVVADAAKLGVLRAKKAGSVRPLLVLRLPAHAQSSQTLPVCLLAVLQGLYEPLETREAHGAEVEPVAAVGFEARDEADGAAIVEAVGGIEVGRRLARDIGGPDPERMAPLRCAEFITNAFRGLPNVTVSVLDDVATLAKEYPLLFSVARASIPVARHRPCVVHIEYSPPSTTVEDTLMFAGKGVTYDTGGADVKVQGFMAGMSRDKCGAANVAGFLRTAAALQPPSVRIVAELGFVRNSIGSDAYVADEIITSHAGVRVKVGNTDAEGRMVLADCLSHLREQVEKQSLQHVKIMTMATLTGHVGKAYGSYTAGMDNGPARQLGVSRSLQDIGELWGEPLEISVLRKEDFDFVKPKNSSYDLIQAGPLPSGQMARGHQYPAAFLQIASGLKKHGLRTTNPLCFTHLDIAGSAVESDGGYINGKPTGSPLVTLTVRYLLPRLAALARLIR